MPGVGRTVFMRHAVRRMRDGGRIVNISNLSLVSWAHTCLHGR